jgi:hypothetical protein
VSIELRIDRIVLDGLDGSAAAEVDRAVQTELRRLLVATPVAVWRARHRDRETGRIKVETAERLGRDAARMVYAALLGGGR